MAGLYASAGAFFSYYLLVVGTFLFTSSIFRLFGMFPSPPFPPSSVSPVGRLYLDASLSTGTITQNYDQANKLASLVLTFFELLSGYLIPVRPSFTRPLPRTFLTLDHRFPVTAIRSEEMDRYVSLVFFVLPILR
jgi:hypothetical protein